MGQKKTAPFLPQICPQFAPKKSDKNAPENLLGHFFVYILLRLIVYCPKEIDAFFDEGLTYIVSTFVGWLESNLLELPTLKNLTNI